MGSSPVAVTLTVIVNMDLPNICWSVSLRNLSVFGKLLTVKFLRFCCSFKCSYNFKWKFLLKVYFLSNSTRNISVKVQEIVSYFLVRKSLWKWFQRFVVNAKAVWSQRFASNCNANLWEQTIFALPINLWNHLHNDYPPESYWIFLKILAWIIVESRVLSNLLAINRNIAPACKGNNTKSLL